MSPVTPHPPRPSLRRPAAVAVLAAAALLAPSAAVAAPSPPDGAAVDALAALEPELQDALGELPAPVEEQVADALVPQGRGTAVAVAVEAPDGGLSVERLDVAPAEAADVAAALDGEGPVAAASVVGTMRAVGDVVPAPAATSSAATSSAAAGGTDPLRPQQWGLDALRAERVRAAATGTPVVAVVDSGVDGTHEDLAGVVLPGTDLVSSRGGDGWRDLDGHGTHVAGTVAAVVGNGRGGQGVLDDVRVLPVRVLDADGAGYTDDIAEGVVWATDHGADVVNMSLGGPGQDRVLSAAVAYAVGHGVVVVAAMGNEGLTGSPVSYPAADRDVLAVTALDKDRRRAGYSSLGSHADLAAPGTAVVSTVPGNGYGWSSGTSMASPHVAAAAAALAGAVPGASAAEIADALTGTSADLGPAGRDTAYGSGLVDPVEALALLRASTSVVPAAPRSAAVTSADRRAAVSWRAPSTAGGGGRPTGYEVEVRGKGQPLQRAVLGASVTTWTATGLVNGLGYEVRVRATNAGGAGPWAATVVARPATTPSAPVRPAVRDGDRSGVVSWSPPSSHGGSAVTGYEVLVRGKGQPDQRFATTSRSVTVKGLVNGLGYEVSVRARNARGLGPAATVVARPRTLPSAPRSPSAVSGSSKTSARTVEVRWSAPGSHGGAVITGYQVVLRQNGTTRDVTYTAAKGATSLGIGGLRNGTGYTAVVRAVNAAGVGPASARTGTATAR
ncbi:S8 family serine peptidase [Pseudokineococcus basanitobsidens]|uniref:S8 family serine peptidase n=1 Tax=Pseudokineococcus basanitobsidens TaxID=1926649 RepID=A0ABU8RL71_9ACTN